MPEAMAFDRLTDQVRGVAAMMIKAGNDPAFFRENQLRLMDRGHRMSGHMPDRRDECHALAETGQ